MPKTTRGESNVDTWLGEKIEGGGANYLNDLQNYFACSK